jgi:hypothetical protein
MSVLNRSGKVAVIAGAGPAGLTAALELLRRSDITPIVFEVDSQVGGISKTVNYRGNRMDLGGHRFFSKSEWVMRWWQGILPVAQGQLDPDKALRISYQQQSHDFSPAAIGSSSSDAVMLVRQRLSRIFHRRRFFDYPLKLNTRTLRNMGIVETLAHWSQLRPRTAPAQGSGGVLGGLPGQSIRRPPLPDLLQGLHRKSVGRTVPGNFCRMGCATYQRTFSDEGARAHAVLSPFRSSGDTSQKQTETSLIERFLYPKFGPGQMWEEVARQVGSRGGEIHLRHRIVGIERKNLEITAITTRDEVTGSARRVPCDFFVSTMPVRELAAMLEPDDPRVLQIADWASLSRLHDRGPAAAKNEAEPRSSRSRGPTACPRTTGSTSRNRMSKSGAFRYSTIGAQHW